MLAFAPGPLKYQINLTATALAGATVCGETRRLPRILFRPRPGFYVIRLRRGARLGSPLICQLYPMVVPQPTTANGTNPAEVPTPWIARRSMARGSMASLPPSSGCGPALAAAGPARRDTPFASGRCSIGHARTFSRPGRERRRRASDGFVAQWQLHNKPAEASHKREKEPSLKGLRVSMTSSSDAARANPELAPVTARLKTYRDRIAATAGDALRQMLRQTGRRF